LANSADTTINGKIVQVTYSGTGDDWNHDTNAGLKHMHVRAIIWYPGAANDILVINEGGIDGASIVQWKASAITDTKQIVFGSPGVRLHPYIDLTDCTYGAITGTKIIFILD